MDLTIAERTLASIYNWFDTDRLYGEFVIEDGELGLNLIAGQYFRIVGSALNDGLHQAPAVSLKDERFDGEVWKLSIPKAFESIVDDISNWQEKHPIEKSGYTSESFGGYSYSLPTNSQTGQAAGWQDVFRSALNPYRKLPGC